MTNGTDKDVYSHIALLETLEVNKFKSLFYDQTLPWETQDVGLSVSYSSLAEEYETERPTS